MEKERQYLPASDLDWKDGDNVRIGLGATLGGFGLDRSSVTVVHVSNDLKKVWVMPDGWERMDTNGMSESQTYRFYRLDGSENPDNWTLYTLRKNGHYVQDGQDLNNGRRLNLGFRQRWHNFSF